MATTISSQALKISLIDVGGSTTTLKLENPIADLSLETIRNTFAAQFADSTAVIESANNELFTAIPEAYYETVSRTTIE